MFNVMMDTWSSLAMSPWNALSLQFGVLPPATSDTGRRAREGQFIEGRFDADIGSLRYKLFIPSGYKGKPLPLIVMLHGCGQDADDFASGTGMNELAEKLGCLVLYPEQSRGVNSNRCWSWFDKDHHERGRGEPALIAGVTGKILSEYAVDRARVCVAGLSAGGAMAVIMGRTYPDLYAAVGCHSGLAHGSARDLYGALLAMREGDAPHAPTSAEAGIAVPIIVFHGDMDATVHIKNGSRVVQQSIDTYSCHPRNARARSRLKYWEETGEARGRGFTRAMHRGRQGEIVAEQWTVHGGGHAWSGGNCRGSYTDSNGPDASREMVRFFMGR
ncbi:extracellular catalytic domain type 1 short-chain-length polyhydroxyalkanoate depolymerase [Pseudoduganella namucuonensis]|uniref:Esterase, PHB depolymerase family n=1 Tax=Pseudoduganella namucuonensis TaxID=1035707 RepID=A0A1I7LNA6_9BURK|nr:PHB depolymerase family esterase [Pseudoduganella namucuonensis]SFV11181.1 esterase, PHB depolymerase family [Pseudoduganella namucuonensis]